MNEIWKNIEGFEDYQISNMGNVKNIKKNTIKKSYMNRYGYPIVNLYKHGINRKYTIYSLVTKVFLPRPSVKYMIQYKDGDRTNNKINNLQWKLIKELNIYNPRNQKLTAKQVKNILEILQCPIGRTNAMKYLSERYNIKRKYLRRIYMREYWKHI